MAVYIYIVSILVGLSLITLSSSTRILNGETSLDGLSQRESEDLKKTAVIVQILSFLVFIISLGVYMVMMMV